MTPHAHNKRIVRVLSAKCDSCGTHLGGPFGMHWPVTMEAFGLRECQWGHRIPGTDRWCEGHALFEVESVDGSETVS